MKNLLISKFLKIFYLTNFSLKSSSLLYLKISQLTLLKIYQEFHTNFSNMSSKVKKFHSIFHEISVEFLGIFSKFFQNFHKFPKNVSNFFLNFVKFFTNKLKFVSKFWHTCFTWILYLLTYLLTPLFNVPCTAARLEARSIIYKFFQNVIKSSKILSSFSPSFSRGR